MLRFESALRLGIKPLVSEIPSYIKDTKHFLQVLRDLERLPTGAILVTADVVGLYPHIPHEEGLSAMRGALEKSHPYGRFSGLG